MRIDVTRDEFQTIIDALGGQILKCERKTAAKLRERLDIQLHPRKAPESNGWAPVKRPPIRSYWPSGMEKTESKSNWSYKKPRKKPTTKHKPSPLKKVFDADEILASL